MTEARQMKQGFTVVLSLFVVSCVPLPRIVGQDYFKRAVPFCAMMANQDKYIDRQVLVSGMYIATPHQVEIYGAGCNSNSIALHGDVSVPSDRRALSVIRQAEGQISGARIPIVAKGVLKKYVGPGIADTSHEFWLEGAQIIAADGTRVQRPSV